MRPQARNDPCNKFGETERATPGEKAKREKKRNRWNTNGNESQMKFFKSADFWNSYQALNLGLFYCCFECQRACPVGPRSNNESKKQKKQSGRATRRKTDTNLV